MCRQKGRETYKRKLEGIGASKGVLGQHNPKKCWLADIPPLNSVCVSGCCCATAWKGKTFLLTQIICSSPYEIYSDLHRILEVLQSQAAWGCSVLSRGWDPAYLQGSSSASCYPHPGTPLPALPHPGMPPSHLLPAPLPQHQPSSVGTDILPCTTMDAGCSLHGLVHLHPPAWLSLE